MLGKQHGGNSWVMCVQWYWFQQLVAVHMLLFISIVLFFQGNYRHTDGLLTFQAAVAVFRAFGDRWTVPWPGETILQVKVPLLIVSIMNFCL